MSAASRSVQPHPNGTFDSVSRNGFVLLLEDLNDVSCMKKQINHNSKIS